MAEHRLITDKEIEGTEGKRNSFNDITKPQRAIIDGKRLPSLTELVSICDVLGCDIDYFISDMEYKTHDSEYVAEFTGLTEPSIDTLHKWKSNEKSIGFSLNYLATLNKLLADFHDRQKEIKSIDGKLLHNYTAEDDEKYGRKKNTEKEVQYSRIKINDCVTNIINKIGTIEE